MIICLSHFNKLSSLEGRSLFFVTISDKTLRHYTSHLHTNHDPLTKNTVSNRQQLVQGKPDSGIATSRSFTAPTPLIPLGDAVETGSELFGLVLMLVVVVVQELLLAQHRQAAFHAIGQRRDVGAGDEVGGQVEEVHEHLVAITGGLESRRTVRKHTHTHKHTHTNTTHSHTHTHTNTTHTHTQTPYTLTHIHTHTHTHTQTHGQPQFPFDSTVHQVWPKPSCKAQ